MVRLDRCGVFTQARGHQVVSSVLEALPLAGMIIDTGMRLGELSGLTLEVDHLDGLYRAR